MISVDEMVIRDASPGDAEAIVDLLSLCLGPGSVPRTVEVWRWKHEASVFGASPVRIAVTPTGEIVAVRAFSRWRWWSGDRPLEAVRAVDTATHPDWRGRGLFSRLTRELADRERDRGTAFVFNTPNRSSGPGYLKLGWRAIGRAPLLVRPLRLGRLLFSMPARPGRPTVGSRLRSVAELLAEPGLDRLLESHGDDPRLSTRTTREYLGWRYRDAPGIEYLAAWNDDAAIVVRPRQRRNRYELSVSEILSVPGGSGVRGAAALVRQLASISGADYVVTIASPGAPERAAARAASLFPVPGLGPRLFVRELASSSGSLRVDAGRPDGWRLTTGVLELF